MPVSATLPTSPRTRAGTPSPPPTLTGLAAVAHVAGGAVADVSATLPTSPRTRAGTPSPPPDPHRSRSCGPRSRRGSGRRIRSVCPRSVRHADTAHSRTRRRLRTRGVNLYVFHASLTDFHCFDWLTDVLGNPYGLLKKQKKIFFCSRSP